MWCSIIIKRATRNDWDCLGNTKLCVWFFKKTKLERSWFYMECILPCTVSKTAWIQTGIFLLGEISQKERSYCWKILKTEAIHHEIESKKTQTKPIQMYVNIFRYLWTLNPWLQWDVRIQDIALVACLRLKTWSPQGGQHPSGADYTRRGNEILFAEGFDNAESACSPSDTLLSCQLLRAPTGSKHLCPHWRTHTEGLFHIAPLEKIM